MNKPKEKIIKIMDWNSMESFIEKKYDCILRDFAAHKYGVHKEKYGTTSYNVKHQFEWEENNFPRIKEFRKNPVPNYGLNQEGLDFYTTAEGHKWFNSIRESYNSASDGKRKELPMWDFWNFLVDKFDVSNGIICQLNWKELKNECDEDWQKEVCELFIKEFGDEDINIEFSW